MDANVKDALTVFETADQVLTEKSSIFKSNFLSRFSGLEDKSDYLSSKKSPITDLLKIYRDYWRQSLLNPQNSYDSALTFSLFDFFSKKYTTKNQISFDAIEDSLTQMLPRYIHSLGLQTTGYANTGKLKDLLVWTKQLDTTYHFKLHREKIKSRVIMLDEFITLGWQEYATLGRNYPGGWTTNEALYCVRSAYDIHSESFLVGYLAHEGRHFSDYRIFPNLVSADLEYRAKLTELSMAKTTIYDVLTFFINNSNYNSSNPHSVANYYVIRNLSRLLFQSEFENSTTKWKTIPLAQINKLAYQLLQKNTRLLKQKGQKTVQSVITL